MVLLMIKKKWKVLFLKLAQSELPLFCFIALAYHWVMMLFNIFLITINNNNDNKRKKWGKKKRLSY